MNDESLEFPVPGPPGSPNKGHDGLISLDFPLLSCRPNIIFFPSILFMF